MDRRLGVYWVITGIVCAFILLSAAYFYTKQLYDCDHKHGVMVKSGFSMVCVDEGRH